MPTASQFTGKLSGNGLSRSVDFCATVDDNGKLEIDFEPLPENIDNLTTPRIAGTPIVPLTLTGRGANGELFATDSLYLRDYRYRTGTTIPAEHLYRCRCSEAALELPQAVSAARPRIVWQVRQLQTYNAIVHCTHHGALEIVGARAESDFQLLTGSISLEAPGPVDTEWWTTAEQLLEHITRALSFGCGTYLQPIVEHRIDRSRDRMRVFDRSDTFSPFLAPFRFFYLEAFVQCACDTFPVSFDTLKALDVALRWLLVPAHYDEMKLITTMTALESILDIHFSGAAYFIKKGFFKKKVEKAVRQCLRDLDVDPAMLKKVPELNRWSFSDKLEDYIKSHAIMVDDLPKNWCADLVRVRNDVAHRGIHLGSASGGHTDLWPHILVARELMIRIILTVLGFQGRYFGQLDINQELEFPKCQPVRNGARIGAEVVAE